MAHLKVIVLGLTTIYFCGVFPGTGARNFPINGCTTDEMDLLFLLLNGGGINLQQQISENKQFIHDLMSVHSNTTQRVLFAEVIDKFSVFNPHVDVSSWRFHSSPGTDPYGVDEQHNRRQQYRNLQEALDLKIQFVQRLFSEMSGVRENVSRVAVLYIDGAGFSLEETKTVGHIVQRHSTDIKIFSMLTNDKFSSDIVFLNDALLVANDLFNYPMHGLTSAICGQCMEGWFMFEHNDITRSISCYKLVNSYPSKIWSDARSECSEQGSKLAVVEKKAELHFLRTKMVLHFTELINHEVNVNQSFQPSIYVYVGLYRNLGKVANRFQWLLTFVNYRPLVVNNWMRGKPSGGHDLKCGVWQFTWNNNQTDTFNSSENKSNGIVSSWNNPNNDINIDGTKFKGDFIDGWVDVGCDTKLSSFSLCEIGMSRVNEGKNLQKIKPAMNESLSRALAKGDFTTFGDNIVSVSSNIPSLEFRQFLQHNGSEFPIFDCGVGDANSQYISYIYVCDNVDHCSNRLDETLCKSNRQTSKDEVNEYLLKCEGVYCCDGSCLPRQYVNDGEIDCLICGYGLEKNVNDESEVIMQLFKLNEVCALTCNMDKCVHFSQLNDGIQNCNGIDGPLDETVGKLKTSDTCFNAFNQRLWAPRCVYIKDRYGAVMGCRDVSHLEDCSEFQCDEGYFKCPNNYCIPQHYVLDGQVDCPSGEDELVDIIDSCTGNFACWDSLICLHPDLICDGHPDCPHGDDEIDCRVFCFDGFRCVSGTAIVIDYNRSVPFIFLYQLDRDIRYLNLSGIDLSDTDLSISNMHDNLLVVILSNCRINNSIIQYLYSLFRIRVLDLSYNLIQAIDGSYINVSPRQNIRHLNLSYNKELAVLKYLQITSLETLDLSHTGLSDLDESFLAGLPNLKHLNLSFTFVTGFQRNVFPSGLVIQSLDMRGIHIERLITNNFNGLTVSQHLFTDSFELCCPQVRGKNIPDLACHAPKDAISSCFYLIAVDIQRVLLWMVAVLAVLGNITVVIYRVFWDRTVFKKGYGLFVTNLGISDFIMGVYLFIIAGADNYYRGVYVLFDKSWRESTLCKFAGFLATLSSETSTFFVLLITLDRFLGLKFPFGQIRLSQKLKIISLLFSWMFGSLLALAPIVFEFKTFSTNAMCLGLPLTTKRLKGWAFSFGVFIVLNFFLCLFIAFSQRAIFQAMSANRLATSASSTLPRRAQDAIVAKQLFLISLSPFLCWFPVGVMGLLSLCGYEISDDVYAWTTVIVLPINSAANPLLYTIPVLMAKWESYKHGGRKSRRRSI